MGSCAIQLHRFRQWETFEVNADSLTVGGSDFDGEETLIQRCLRNRFSIGACATLRWLGPGRKAPLHRL